MSSIASSTHPYASALIAAQNAYILNPLADPTGSVLNLTAECNDQVRKMNATNAKAENYEQIKGKFIHFTKTSIPLYEAMQIVRNLGLAAIETIKQAQAKGINGLSNQLMILTNLTGRYIKQIKALEASLNSVFYTQKVMEGKKGHSDTILTAKNFYLAQALTEYKEAYKRIQKGLPAAVSNSLQAVHVAEEAFMV